MFRSSLRHVPRTLAAAPARSFHATPRALVKVGDEVPAKGTLYENSAASTVNLADEFQAADGYIVGVPGAFTGTCSSKHIPSWLNHPALSKAGKVFVVAVNDPFVMKAWAEQLDPSGQTGVRFIADPSGDFAKSLDLLWHGGVPIFGGPRSQRYALKVQNGKISKTHLEPDETGANESMAEKVLG